MSVVRTRVEADLRFGLEMPGRAPVSGSVTGHGSDLTLTVSDPEVFAGRADAELVRRLALELNDAGLVVRVRDRDGVGLVALGAVRAPWWQRPFTRSAHVRVAGLRGLLGAWRGRQGQQPAALPGTGLLPPATPYPVAPTFLRRPVRRVTTTHDAGRGGGPRLIELPVTGLRRTDHPTHWLQRERTVIGSDPTCDIVLPGLAGVHAEVRHDEADEFVLVAHDPEVRVHGDRVTTRLLRTSARIALGDRVLTFVREEYADHGRPYGGRIGGELGHQRRQRPRPAARPAPGADPGA